MNMIHGMEKQRVRIEKNPATILLRPFDKIAVDKNLFKPINFTDVFGLPRQGFINGGCYVDDQRKEFRYIVSKQKQPKERIDENRFAFFVIKPQDIIL